MSKSNTCKFVSKYDKSRFVPICHYCGVEGHIRPKCFKLKNSQNIPLGRKVSQNTKFNNVLENNFSNKNRIHKFSPRNKFLHNDVCFSCGKFGHKIILVTYPNTMFLIWMQIWNGFLNLWILTF